MIALTSFVPKRYQDVIITVVLLEIVTVVLLHIVVDLHGEHRTISSMCS